MHGSSPAETPVTTLVTWNVLKGFRGGERADEASAWLAERAPDVVALQELSGWTEPGLADLAPSWGHAHVALANEAGDYPLGLTSRTPITVLERRMEGLHHGLLHARTARLDLVVVHLNPRSWAARVAEARSIVPLLERLLRDGRALVVLGDFNAHAAVDRERLAARGPLLARRRERRPDDLRRDTRGGQAFDTEALETFLALGLHDLEAERLSAAELAGTRPTRLPDYACTPELQAGFLERIDHVLADPATAARCVRAAVPRGGVLERVSDHYPVVVELRSP